MAHSIEMRLPLLDVELIEVVTGLRNAGLEDWARPHKWLLIEAVGNVLPREILYRKKQGFTPPVHTWLTKITNAYKPLLNQGALVSQGILDSNKIASIATRVSESFLYKLVLLELWARLVIEGTSVSDIADEVSELGRV
jgi:asparagine synthase (glutamine-hydrolysing)